MAVIAMRRRAAAVVSLQPLPEKVQQQEEEGREAPLTASGWGPTRGGSCSVSPPI
jgi:hypothetical protein|eukprot:COSAG06_NODE_4938_length_3846_cov_29.655006_4_plen_55_part_00